ncbi:hypothetical protein OEA41_008301 [Lepraria neglecta]|uniref:NB-ARC domain-containing protein n=1 Tax=Lepraria neglecta TaxID=209136 RepID=A0AAD9ZF47_9LECA|nr:hypothetical protein OEA41_008301 [Lepraria neglecta]
MQASHLDVRQEGSHFGDTNAFHSQIFQGNFHGLTINPTAAAQIPPSTYEGHYANSSLRPVPNYVPRPRLHLKIKEQLHDLQDDGVEDMRILVVWGLGGAGKSQLVLNYIREYRKDYSAVFWIESGSKESIERDYIQIYRLLYGRPLGAGQEMVKVEDAVPAVKRWFHGREGRWLVVLDSADIIDNDQDKSYIDLEYFLPDAPRVHIIITSRSSTARGTTALDAVEVAEMEPSEAIELFQRYAKIKDKGQDIATEAAQIVKELGYLALAITLAGSYVSVTARLSSDIRRYLPEYQQRRKELLRRRATRHIHQYGESVLSTWEVSFEAINNHNPAAARLLGLLAFINFEDIFLGLFNRDGASILASAPTRITEPLEATTSPDKTWQTFLFCGQKWTAYDLESAFETLQSYSLIQWKSDQGSYTMHKLVHAWGQDRLEADRQRRLSNLALELIADTTAQGEIDPSHQLRLVPHIMASFDIFSLLQESLDELTIGRLTIVYRIEGFLFRIGRWSEAYKIQVFHFRRTEKMLGKEHPSTLTSMNNLALVLSSQGNYEEAERIDRQALALRETVLGKEHPDTLGSMNNLAEVLSSQGNYEEAERIHRQALALRETVLGKEHPSTLTSMNNLASVLSSQGNYEEAERIHRQVLALNETVLGKKHPDTLTSMNNLAWVLSRHGNYEDSERIYRQALALMERVLGKEHPDTLISMNNLASVLSMQGNYEEAERIHRQALALKEMVLGKKHPSTLGSISNLAEVLRSQGNYEEAERIHRQALALRETVLGKQHPDTLTSMNNLAEVLSSQGNYEEAERIHRQALALRETVLGKQHPDTLTSMNNLAEVLRSQGNYEEAERIHRQALALNETVLGKKHPDTLTSMNNLALVLSSEGNYEEAERIHRQALALRETVLGKEHPNTLGSMNNLAEVLRSQGNYEEAERIHRQALALNETVLGKKHPDTLTSMNNLALVLSSQGNYEEAERIHRQALALKERVVRTDEWDHVCN